MLKYLILLIVVIVMMVTVFKPSPTHAVAPVFACIIGDQPGEVPVEDANIILLNNLCICAETDPTKSSGKLMFPLRLHEGVCESHVVQAPCSSNPNKTCCILTVRTKVKDSSVGFRCVNEGGGPLGISSVEYALFVVEHPTIFEYQLIGSTE